MNGTDLLETRLPRLQRRAFIVGSAGLALCILAGLLRIAPLRIILGAYLIGYLYVLGITLGCLAILMIHHLAGGSWGMTIRRVLEAASRTIPWMAALFLPILLGIGVLYEWSHAKAVAADELLQHKRLYLNIPFFVARSILYFAIWSSLAILLNRWARDQERAANLRVAQRLRMLSGPGLVLYGLMMTFAAIDWAMSLEPHWYSTIYGVLFIVGQAANGMAFAIAATMLVSRWRAPASPPPTPALADLGSLMLAFVMLWAYITLSQFLIVWSGNLPEEIPWYIARMRAGWGGLGLTLILFHFFIPFALLLRSRMKRDPCTLILLTTLIMVMRAVDLVWIIAPSFSSPGQHGGLWTALLTPLAIIGIGGIWLSLFVGQLRSRSLLPYPTPTTHAVPAHPEVAS